MTMATHSSNVGVPPRSPDDFDVFAELVRSRVAKLAGAPIFTVAPVAPLYQVYLEAFGDAEARRVHSCHSCRRFIECYGHLAVIEDGKQESLLWRLVGAPEPYARVAAGLDRAVCAAAVSGVYLSSEPTWGKGASTPPAQWSHFEVPSPSIYPRNKPHNAEQVMAQKRGDYTILQRSLSEYNIEVVQKALGLLQTDSLYRAEKVLGVAEWLLRLHVARAATQNKRERDNFVWSAVATAPDGFSHVRTTMIGSLLDDLVGGLPFEAVARRFAAKMDPLQYLRPQAPPSEQNIAHAEKIVSQLRSAGALGRRFAKLSDIVALWVPDSTRSASKRATETRQIPIESVGAERLRVLLRDAKIDPFGLSDDEVVARYRERFGNECTINSTAAEDRERNGGAEEGGVFSHLKPKVDKGPIVLDAPPTVLTWDKFSRTVLPVAERIEFVVPNSREPYVALVTAADASAPPLLQWDTEERRNPVSWYLYNGGSSPSDWNLVAGAGVAVTAITLLPPMWYAPELNERHGVGVILILSGAKDMRYERGGGFFPESLRGEYHAVRRTMEAHARQAPIVGRDEAQACGYDLRKGSSKWNCEVHVTSRGVVTRYRLDRWD